MKIVLSALLSLALLFAASLDAAHAAPRGGDLATTQMPHHGDGADEMECCDAVSGRTASCLGDLFAVGAWTARPATLPVPVHFAVSGGRFADEFLCEPPMGPLKV